MPLDALTIACLADEIRTECLGGRIQAVLLPAPLSLGLEIYARGKTHFLFASAHPQRARVHLAEGKLSRGSDDVTPLLLLLRKYVRDGRLVAVEHPALERTLSLIIAKAGVFDKGRDDKGRDDKSRDDTGGNAEIRTRAAGSPAITTTRIIIEIMGRYSNIVLVDEAGLVMEAAKHVSADVNRYRVTLPRHPYVDPPPQGKADPRGASVQSVAQALAAAGEQRAWQALVAAYAGVSPLLAREAVFRAAGDSTMGASEAPAQAVAEALAMLVSTPYHGWSPSALYSGESMVDFAPYELTQPGGRARPVASMSSAIHEYFAQETAAADYAGLKQALAKSLATLRQRLLRRQESLRGQQASADQAESLRTSGEMILACTASIQPGQRELVADLGDGSPPLNIALDPALTAVENAQGYFKRYTRARDAERSLPALVEQAQLDLAYLEQIEADLALADSPAAIQAVRDELDEASAPPPAATAGQASKAKNRKPGAAARLSPLSVTSADGMQILVGRNARQNDTVTFELASALDTWLHARGVPGSHVIIRNGGRPVAPDTLRQAAALAAAYSSAHGSTSVAVVYTQRRNVHRRKGAGPGMVTFSNEQTIQARPAAPPQP